MSSRAALTLLSGALGACSVWARYTSPPEQCQNRIDDDADGLVDCDDPHCACEDSARFCSDFVDNDRDGAFDAEEPICWKESDVIAPLDTTAGAGRPDVRRCSSALETNLELGDEDWTWSAGSFPAEQVMLDGGEQCSGLGVVTDTCQYLHTRHAVSGGSCWSVSVDLRFADDDEVSELDVVVAPSLDPEQAPLGAASSTAFGVRRVPGAGGAALELRALSSVVDDQGRARVEIATDARPAPPPGPLRLRIGTGEAGCAFERISVELSAPDGSAILSLDPGEIAQPSTWTPTGILEVGVQAAAPGRVAIDDIEIHRERHDPCGFPFPQITGGVPGDDTAPAVVLAAARGGGMICAVGATPTGPTVEREFVPIRDQGSPPELGPGDPAPPSQPFASWRAADLGLDSFGTDAAGSPALIAGPVRPAEFVWEDVRAATLDWHDDVGFEGILLVSDAPRAGGFLIRARSDDCESWSFDVIESLDRMGTLHPVLYEIDEATTSRRLLLADPAEGYHGVYDQHGCEPQPWAAFSRGADAIPVLKAPKSECMRYPRAGLREASSVDAELWSLADGELAAMPALSGQWSLRCGCLGDVEFISERTYPAAVTQLLEAGGFRAFVASGRLGIEVVVDRLPDSGLDFDVVSDGLPLANPLLVPTSAAGTFDEAVVRDGHLVLLDASSPGEVEALLFYRGFRGVSRDAQDEDLLRLRGGAVGVIPVRILRAGSDGPSTGSAE